MEVTAKNAKNAKGSAGGPPAVAGGPPTRSSILECLSECEFALSDAVNKDKIGWLQEEARDNAREMLKKAHDAAEE